MISKISPGVTATAEANVDGSGTITSIDIIITRDNNNKIIFNGWGSNYIFAPLVTITGTGSDATAVSYLDTNGHVNNIVVTNAGTGYTIGNTFVILQSPDTYPTREQTTLVFNSIIEDYAEKQVKPTNMKQAVFNNGMLKQIKYTDSSSIITNPLKVLNLNKETPVLNRDDAVYYDRSSENDPSFPLVRNRSRLPIDESRYTHKLRVDRNDNSQYIINKGTESVDKIIAKIVIDGGEDAVILSSVSGSSIDGFTVRYGGRYYMSGAVNSPTFIVERQAGDPGIATARAVVNAEGKITELVPVNVGSGYSSALPPEVTIHYSDATEIATAVAVVVGEEITSYTITNNGKGYSRFYAPTITVKRKTGDPGIATGIVAIVDKNGMILTTTVTNAGSGYTDSNLPKVTLMGGKGQVNKEQRNELLQEVLGHGLDHLNPSKIYPKESTESKGKSSTIVKPDHRAHIVDVTDKLLRTQRLEYKNQLSVINSKAAAAALKRFQVAYPNIPAIPPPPAPITIKVTGYVSGRGYDGAPTIDFSLGGGVLAQGTVSIDSNGAVTSVSINDGGLYYKTSSVIFIGDFVAEGGVAASGVTVVKDGVIQSVELNKGQNAILLPQLTRVEGEPDTAQITGVDIFDGGTGYPDGPPVVTIDGNGAIPETTATAIAKVNSSGQISGFIITNAGIDYNSVPNISITGGGGRDFSGTVVLTNKKVTSITINNSGQDYTSLDFIVATGAAGSGASGVVVTQNGVITQVNMTDLGSNYEVQQPPNPIYLEYLAEAERQSFVPPEKVLKLPEPTLKDQKGNMMLEKQITIQELIVPAQDSNSWPERLNPRKTNRNRAKASVISVAVISRQEAKAAWIVYEGTPTTENLIKAKAAYDKAIKATQAAYQLQKWLPSNSDKSLVHGRELNALYALI